MNKRIRLFKWGNARTFLIVLALAGMTAEILYAWKSPAVYLLPPFFDGEWVRADEPVDLHAQKGTTNGTIFRKRFSVAHPQQGLEVDVTAFRYLTAIALDGNPLSFSDPSSWKNQIHIVIPGRLLLPGIHELRLTVMNRLGPSLLHVSSTLPGLGNAEGWEESTFEGDEWRPVLRADEQRAPAIRESFPSVMEALRTSFPRILPLFLGIFVLSVMAPKLCSRISAPESVRVLLLVFLGILGVNNVFQLGRTITSTGFDVWEHLAYISYLLENHRIPLASEGWQMFQPPLYYALSAALLVLFQPFVTANYSYLILWVIPLGCLLLLVEITYRMLRELLPEKRNLQSVGLFVGGLLPMNLYMCHFVGNEPLTAVLTALLIFLTVKYLKVGKEIRVRDIILLGIVAGLAILSKVTPLILIPVICVFILSVLPYGKGEGGSPIKAAGIFAFVTFVVSGWFFLRNWIVLGKPFYGGWDPSRRIVWWQEPGYRILKDYYSFGEALKQPVYAAFHGFADALYSTFWGDGYNICEHLVTIPELPHWNYIPLTAGIAFSVVPALTIAGGTAVSLWRAREKEHWPFTFLLASIGVYFAALLHLFTVLPTYSTVKASYTMGLTPCYAVMAALGSDFLMGEKFIGPLFISLMVSWGIMTYIGFFIL